MSISKIIKFYQFEPQPSMLNNGLTETKTIDLISVCLARWKHNE